MSSNSMASVAGAAVRAAAVAMSKRSIRVGMVWLHIWQDAEYKPAGRELRLTCRRSRAGNASYARPFEEAGAKRAVEHHARRTVSMPMNILSGRAGNG